MKINRIFTIIFLTVIVGLAGCVCLTDDVAADVNADAEAACQSFSHDIPQGSSALVPPFNTCRGAYKNHDTVDCNSVGQGVEPVYKQACEYGQSKGAGAAGNPNNPTNPNGTCTTDGAQGNDGKGICSTSGQNKCGTVNTTILKCDGYDQDGSQGLEKSGLMGIVVFALQIVTGSVIIAAVGALAWGGFQYASAQGNQQQVQQSISTIRNTIIGIVAFVLFIAIVEFLSPAKIFS